MKFSDFKSVEDVQAKYPLLVTKQRFIPDVEVTPSELFLDDLDFILSMETSVESELFYRESYIFPFMKQVWKQHRSVKLWVNRKLAYKDELTGEPDYFVSSLPEKPTHNPVGKLLLAVAEAKQEDFIEGWGQCLAAMIACKKINDAETIPIYGIVSAGQFWQFGKLEGETFTRHITAYTVHEPAKLLGVLDYLFAECERQATATN